MPRHNDGRSIDATPPAIFRNGGHQQIDELRPTVDLIFADQDLAVTRPVNFDRRIMGKILIGEDQIDRWPEFIDLLVASISENGGRSCINASAIVVPRHAREIAQSLAEKL